MGLRIVGKGDYVLKRKDYETIKKSVVGLSMHTSNTVSALESANGSSKGSQFQDGFYAFAETESKKAKEFLEILKKTMEGL